MKGGCKYFYFAILTFQANVWCNRTEVEAHTQADIGLSRLCSASIGVLSLMTPACSHMNDWAVFYNDLSKSTFWKALGTVWSHLKAEYCFVQ